MKDAKRTRGTKSETDVRRIEAAERAGAAEVLATTLAKTHLLAPVRSGALGGCGVWMRGGAAGGAARIAGTARRGVHWAYLHCAAVVHAVMMSV